MISHTLPDASSAVAFEYERENADDLRLVVMHCRPNEDSPQFHIVKSGFREDYFFNENRQFVLRDEFKSRVESMHSCNEPADRVTVTQKLYLHQYRSVILNERLATKEGQDLRRLAALHSLGPTALVNLDQIAAAMANEKISFRDLQNIVIDQVSDSQMDGVTGSNNRSLQKDRKDVASWLDYTAQLAKVIASKTKSDAMMIRVGTVKAHHLSLCTMHVAIKSALAQVQDELRNGFIEDKAREEQYVIENNTLLKARATAQQALDQVKTAMNDKGRELDAIYRQQRTFAELDIEAKSLHQNLEPSFLAQMETAKRELAALEKASGDALSSQQEQNAVAIKAHAALVGEIAKRQIESANEATARTAALAEAKADALGGQAPSVRIGEIGLEKQELFEKRGAQRVLRDNPGASAKSLDELECVRNETLASDAQHNESTKAVYVAENAFRTAVVLVDTITLQIRRADLAMAANADALAKLKQRLSPPPNSLLEYLRNSDESLWLDGAKLIEPALLFRTDLNPFFLDPDTNGSSPVGEVHVGRLSVDVSAVEQPLWVSTQGVRDQITKLTLLSDSLVEAVLKVKADGGKADKARKVCEIAVDHCKGNESLQLAARINAQKILERATATARNERNDAVVHANRELARIQEQTEILDREILKLNTEAEGRIDAIKADFMAQQTSLTQELNQTSALLIAETLAADQLCDKELGSISEAMKRQLAGLGIDPEKMQGLSKIVLSLTTSLELIAKDRHNVSAWIDFKREVIPTIPSMVADKQMLTQRHLQVHIQLRNVSAAIETLDQKTKRAVARSNLKRDTAHDEETKLTRALKGRISGFLSHVPKNLNVDWVVPDLLPDMEKQFDALDIQSEELKRETHQQRSLLVSRSGPIEDWVVLHEKDLPDPQILLPHENLWVKAEVLHDIYRLDDMGSLVDSVNVEMCSYLSVAGNFVRDLELFERKVISFNGALQKALVRTEKFERFKDLSVTVRSNVNKIDAIATLRDMRDASDASIPSYRAFAVRDTTMPSETNVQLIRRFKDLLPADGVLRVNLSDQVRMECSLTENGKRQTITTEEEFRAVSSNGNTALITAMFLMGFVQMIRGTDSPVRLTWVTDEIARFDPNNLEAFLLVLDAHRIDVISACPSVDPALARFFKRICMFESTGQIKTSAFPEMFLTATRKAEHVES